jgi:glycosyltransferase involved in cell wall biosynthesis
MILVIPCYNEEKRLRQDEMLRLIEAGLHLVLVNDGSVDKTLPLLQGLAAKHSQAIEVLNLKENSGKAEAVRQGLLIALTKDSQFVGYIDADFATPASEVIRLTEIAVESPQSIVMAARVGLLGADIQRKMTRHYLGRVFATIVSVGLNLHVYDTQCGAKMFRSSSKLQFVLDEKFRSKWIFDVELIGRLLSWTKLEAKDFLEIPLKRWADIDGSKLTFKAMLRAGFDLICFVILYRLGMTKSKKG